MAAFLVRTTLILVVPVLFGYGAFHFLVQLSTIGIFGLPVAAIMTWQLAKQGSRNATEYLADRAAGLTELSPIYFVLKFSVPFFLAIPAAFAADWLDWQYGFFVPSLSGIIAGTVVFVIAFSAIYIFYGPLRSIHIRGQKVLDYRTALTKAIPLGYDSGILFGGIRIPPERATTHFLIVGATGSGKTLTVHRMLTDIASYLRENPSAHAVVYDPKQNILPVLRNIAAGLPVADLHPYRNKSLAWDIARDIRSSRDIEMVSNILFPVEKGGAENRFFMEAPRELTQAVIRCLVRQTASSWSLRDLYCILTSGQSLKALLQSHPAENDLVQEYFNGDERTLNNVRLSLRTKLLRFRPLAASSHYRSQQQQVLSLRDWSDSGGGFLVLGSDKTPDSGLDALNRTALSVLSRHWLEGKNSPSAPAHFLILDEVQSAGDLASLPALLTEGREKGVSTVLSFQDVASMRHVYGKDQSDALLSQFGNKAFLRLEGDSTAQWASKAVGEVEQFEYTYSTSRTSSSGNTSTTTSQNEQRVRKSALMPSDFMTLPPTNSMNGLTGYYASAEIGIWKHRAEPSEIFRDDLDPPEPPSAEQSESDRELEPLNEEDCRRLGLNFTQSDGNQRPRRDRLSDVTPFDLSDD